MSQESELRVAETTRWPFGTSETAALIRTFDWAKTPLGPIESWPQPRKTVVDLVLASNFPMLLLWGDDLVQIYNDAYASILGSRHPKAMGQRAHDSWPEAWHINAPLYERVLQGETVSLKDQVLPMSPDRTPVDACFTLCLSPIRDETGIAGVFVTVIETTENRQAREERAKIEHVLRESEERYRQLSEAVPQIVWSSDAQGNIDFFNSRWYAYTGQRDEGNYTQAWRAAIHPDDLDRTVEEWNRAIHIGKSIDFEYRLRRADGVYRWHMDRAIPVRNEQGQVIRWFGTFTDIDDRKHVEEALRESEERFRQFAEYSTAVLWVLDVDTMRLEYLSPSFQQVWGEPPDAVPRDFAQWLGSVHPDDRESLVTAFNRVRQEGEVIVKEYRVVRPDGTVRWVQNTCFPILDEQRTVRRLAGIAQDVTQHDGSMVYVVDSSETSRRDLSLLFQGAGYQVKAFSTAQSFLEVAPVLVPGCVVLDIQTSETGELAILKELKARRVGLPVIVIGEAHGNVAFGVQAMKAGAVDFLDVPYSRDRLLEAVASALASIREIAERDQAAELAKARIAALSTREREVLDGLLAGGTNKTIARELDISPRTVEAHRARIMERLGAQSLPELVRIAVAAGLQPGGSKTEEDRS